MSTSISTRQQSSATSTPLRVIAAAVATGTAMAAVASYTDPTEADPVRRTAVCLVILTLFASGTIWLVPRLLRARQHAAIAMGLALIALLLVVPGYWVGLPAAFAVPALWLARRSSPQALSRAAMGIAGVALLGSGVAVAFVR